MFITPRKILHQTMIGISTVVRMMVYTTQHYELVLNPSISYQTIVQCCRHICSITVSHRLHVRYQKINISEYYIRILHQKDSYYSKSTTDKFTTYHFVKRKKHLCRISSMSISTLLSTLINVMKCHN